MRRIVSGVMMATALIGAPAHAGPLQGTVEVRAGSSVPPPRTPPERTERLLARAYYAGWRDAHRDTRSFEQRCIDSELRRAGGEPTRLDWEVIRLRCR